MAKVFFLLGGNIDDRLYYIQSAAQLIEEKVGTVLDASSIYESEPWGFSHKSYFLNQVIVVETGLSPMETLLLTQEIEKKLGRVRHGNTYSERTIDIDILFYDNLIIDHECLTVPHPRLHERKFTLMPLSEINPELNHPVLEKKIQVLNEQCSDKLRVNRLN